MFTAARETLYVRSQVNIEKTTAAFKSGLPYQKMTDVSLLAAHMATCDQEYTSK